jgi:pimeloyl-ACP methyl ester carboxylesterase
MTRPTIVLVHGAFADGSSWSGVIERLQVRGYAVEAPANPLRGVTADAAYLSSAIAQIEGPVLIVGHSYGGAVISNADAPNAVGLVFVAAFAPDVDEVLGDVTATSEDSILMPALMQRTYPNDDEPGVEFVVDLGRFRETFAADLPAERPPYWQLRSVRSRRAPSRTSAGSPRGGPSPLGQSSPPATRRRERISSVRWRNVRAPTRSSSRARTWSWCRNRKPWPTTS